MNRRNGRAAVVAALALLAAVVVGFVTLGTGAIPVAPLEALRSVAGSGDGGTDFVVRELVLPRVVAALLVGAALGIAGALIQSLTRNPLGSPDILGFDTGAATAALIGLIVLNLPVDSIVGITVVGGILSAAVVFGLAGGANDSGYRMILIGIGIGGMLFAANGYLLTRSTRQDSYSAARWLAGSLNSSDWNSVLVVSVALVVVVPLALMLAQPLRILALGNDVAQALGIRVGLLSALVLLVAVTAAASAIAAAGPIAFVALAAPQVAQRLARSTGPVIVASAAVGGFVLVSSDLVAQRAFGEVDLPVGVVTGAVGGAYLIWLLSREWRRVST